MRLINDILDLATIEAGYMVLETGRVEVLGMLQAVVSLTRERARSRDLELELRCPPEIGAIEGDERRIKQALFNLISNSIKFTPPGGAISVEAVRQKDALLLTVADTGAGIPHADRARVCEKFERGVRQTATGLGLSLVKSLVELHGGNIVIASASGPGTRITCRLPTPRAAPRVPAPTARPRNLPPSASQHWRNVAANIHSRSLASKRGKREESRS
jgi:signal transduction histidine kinase